MLFNSATYLIYFIIVSIVYFVLPAKPRKIWLLAASYFFYMNWHAAYGLLLLGCTLAAYFSGILLNKIRDDQRLKKAVLILTLVIIFGSLVYFKYLNFLLQNISLVTGLFKDRTFNILLPVGISFFTFQGAGYVIDVYRGTTKTETDFINFALFLSFFPQLVAGPIERSNRLLVQIRETPLYSRKILLDYERIRDGLMLIVYGLFVKMVIADRIAVFVDTVWDRYFVCGSVELILAAAAFSLQIYCDFHSYSTIAIGSAKVLGFDLMENFRAPYFSRSVTEFWRNWHISLSTWFRDYVYIPLGGNRCGKFRKHLNQLITMVISGLWHGANWTFVFWGALNGIYMILENIAGTLFPQKRTAGDSLSGIGSSFFHVIYTFVLTTIGWIFFRSDSLKDAFLFLKGIVTRNDIFILSQDQLYSFGLSHLEVMILLFGLFVLTLADLVRVRFNCSFDRWLSRQNTAFRIAVMLILIMSVLIFGMYGPGFDSKQFIYFQF